MFFLCLIVYTISAIPIIFILKALNLPIEPALAFVYCGVGFFVVIKLRCPICKFEKNFKLPNFTTSNDIYVDNINDKHYRVEILEKYFDLKRLCMEYNDKYEHRNNLSLIWILNSVIVVILTCKFYSFWYDDYSYGQWMELLVICMAFIIAISSVLWLICKKNKELRFLFYDESEMITDYEPAIPEEYAFEQFVAYEYDRCYEIIYSRIQALQIENQYVKKTINLEMGVACLLPIFLSLIILVI